jgi:hypothetical protein
MCGERGAIAYQSGEIDVWLGRALLAEEKKFIIAHPEKENFLARDDLFSRELRHGNIDVTPQQRKKQQGKNIAPMNTHLLVGILKDTDLNQKNKEA